MTILSEKGFDDVFFLSGGYEEFVLKYPQYLEGPDAPKVNLENTNPLSQHGSQQNAFSSNNSIKSQEKVMMYRQAQYKGSNTSIKTGGSGMGHHPNQNSLGGNPGMLLPSINKKKNPGQAFSRKGPQSRNSLTAQNQRFNDIPDNDSYAPSNNLSGIKGNLKHLPPAFRKAESKGEITDKPTNVMFNREEDRMVFKERKLNKMEKELTDKIVSTKNQINYSHFA